MNETGNIDIPKYLQDRPRWKGIYPIPFTTLIKADGTPDFRVTDEANWAFCVSRGACGLCSKPLVYWQAFIGGGMCRESRLFYDPAMHVECAEYAAKVCPFLVGAKDYILKPVPDGACVKDEIPAKRPDKMYLFKTRGYSLVKIEGNVYIKAEPFKFITELNHPNLQEDLCPATKSEPPL